MTGSKTRSTLVKRMAWRAATDERFRERLVSAIAAGIVARRRARRRRERLARVLTTDLDLRKQVEELAAHARRLQRRSEPKHHGVRNFALFVVGVGMVAAAAPVVRRRMRGGDEAPHGTSAATFDADGSTTLVEEIEVAVPVSAAYSQWTQFEEFPKFMEGVDEVTQLDDSLLHWAVSLAGKHAEWDARIVERQPDREIAWESIDGRLSRSSVTFEPAGPSTTRVRLEHSYRMSGPLENAGSSGARVRGDLERFRELIESKNR